MAPLTVDFGSSALPACGRQAAPEPK